MKGVFKKIELVIMAVVLAVCVASTAWASLAWFSNNKKVEENEMDFQIDSDTLLALPMTSYWSHLDDEVLKHEKAVGSKIVLPIYDSVFKEQNTYSSVYIKVPIFGKTVNNGEDFQVDITIRDMDEGKGYEGSEDNKNRFDYDVESGAYSDSVIALYLSNVVRVKYGFIPALNDEDDETESGMETICNTARNFFNDEENPVSPNYFIVPNETTKADKIEFTVSNYSSARKQTADDAFLINLFFEVSYDEELVDELMAHHELALGENAFDIASDFHKFILSVPEK